MASRYKQAGRVGRLATPLGDDRLLLIAFEGREAVSELFRFRLQALATVDAPIDFDDLLGAAVSVSLFQDPNQTRDPARTIHGIVSRIVEMGSDTTFITYELELVPHVFPLTLNVRCRIFETKSVPEILREVLGNHADLSRLKRGKKRNYCVQFDESDFDFAVRLIEEEGWHYYFDATDALGRMTVATDSTLAASIPGDASVLYSPGGRHEAKRHIWSWSKAQQLTAHSHTLRDWTFQWPGMDLLKKQETPSNVLVGQALHSLRHAATEGADAYEYPGGFAKHFDPVPPSGGDASLGEFADDLYDQMNSVAQNRAEATAAQGLTVIGAGNVFRMAPGHTFLLQGHGRGDGDYVLTSLTHSLRMDSFRADSDIGATPYQNEFAAIPRLLSYRTPRRRPRPTIYGHQTATVVGVDGSTIPGDDHIFTESHGRVRVRFHWSEDQANSCWLRVAQSWAGKGWGTLLIPRVGQEVVVGFANGDPDCPLVYGSVYNGENPPPHELPKYKTRTTLMSCTNGATVSTASYASSGSGSGGSTSDDTSSSSSSGSYNSYSGMAIGDSSGEEYLHLHSSGDMLIDTPSNQYIVVKGEQAVYVDGSQIQLVGGMRGLDVDLFCWNTVWQPLSEWGISFADDIWSKTKIGRDYSGPFSIAGHYGSEIQLHNDRLVYDGLVHQATSSVWSTICSLATLFGSTFSELMISSAGFSTFSEFMTLTGLTVGKQDMCGGERIITTDRNTFDMRLGHSYVYTGDYNNLFMILRTCYGLVAYAVKVIAGIADVRENQTWRTVLEILQTLLQYGGNLISALEMCFVRVFKSAVAKIEGAEKVSEFAIEAAIVEDSETAFLAAYRAVVDAEYAVQEAINAVTDVSKVSWFEQESNTAIDHYHYVSNDMVIEAGELFSVKGTMSHIEASSLNYLKGKSISLHASNSINLYCDGASLYMAPTFIKLSVGTSEWILSETGITKEVTSNETVALTTNLVSSPLIEDEE